MGKCCKITLYLVIGLSAWIGYKIHLTLNYMPPIPNLPLDQWWGPGKPIKTIDKSIREFKLEFKADVINDLRLRLSKAKFYTESIEEVGFQYGFNNMYLKKVLEFWSKEYKFEEREKYLNTYPHFKTNIQGLDIHYVHIKPNIAQSNIKIIPLLLVHGWPGSFVEFYKIIPMLTTLRENTNFVCELIIPSLPGFGFSQAPSKSDLAEGQIAVVMKNLMDRLGHKRYMVQGGDWGAGIVNNMAILFPKNILGLHTNMAVAFDIVSTLKMIMSCHLPSYLFAKEHRSEICPTSNILVHLLAESGYFHIQSTKPDTIGVALRDSPAGLAAYILEKFSGWTNDNWKSLPDGGLTKKFTLTELIDNVMIYWITESITTSMRIYAESVTNTQYELMLDILPIKVPSAVTRFKHDLIYQTEGQIRSRYTNLLQFNNFDGGHFAAFEEPIMFADDIWSAAEIFKRNESKNIKTEL